MSKNKLKSFKGLCSMPCLKEMILSENESTSLMDLVDLNNLVKLNVRQNLIEKLNAPRLIRLQEINVEANKVSSFKEFEALLVK